jgi:hypothetical protein
VASHHMLQDWDNLPWAACSRWLLSRGFFYPEYGGNTFLRNVGSHKIYTAPHPRILYLQFV